MVWTRLAKLNKLRTQRWSVGKKEKHAAKFPRVLRKYVRMLMLCRWYQGCLCQFVRSCELVRIRWCIYCEKTSHRTVDISSAFSHILTLPWYSHYIPSKEGLEWDNSLLSLCYLWKDLQSPYSTLLVHKPENFNEVAVCLCVFVSTWAGAWSWIIFWQQWRPSRCEMCECVRPFLCVLTRVRGNENRGCPLGSSTCLCMNTLSTGEVLTHTHTRQRLNLSWHTPPQLCNAVQQHVVWGRLGEVCLLYVCLPSMEFMKELRDQTAADGVCLVAMLASVYPVGQCNWRFLSHQVSNFSSPCRQVPE